MQITLTTTGRRSGHSRPVKLYAFEDGDDDLVITGSRGGAAKDPAWVANLRAEPRATVRWGKDKATTDVRAREVDGAERDRLWELVTTAFPLYATYQRKTMRRIPLFVLERAADAGPT